LRIPEPLVSVIIPTYNYGQYIPEAIESILAQTYQNIEIIVVDDGSTDNTCEIVKKYPYIKYIRQEHKGLASALNTGVKHSKGKFFLALGADDKLHPTYIQRCLEEISKDDKIAFVWTATQEFGKSNRIRVPRILHHRFSVLRGTGGQLGASLIRRKAYEDVGGYDESLEALEDWDFAIRLYKKGWKGKPIFEPLHFVRVHERQLTSSSDKRKEYYKFIEARYPFMILYVPLSRIFDAIVLTLKSPKTAAERLLQKIRKMVI